MGSGGGWWGAETWTELEEFGERKREGLEPFRGLEPGIRSQDRCRRGFSRLPSEAFESRFREGVASPFRVESGPGMASDGQTIPGAG